MTISIAMIALGPQAVLSASAIQADLRATWPQVGEIGVAELEDNMISFRVGEADVILGRMPAPIPWGDLEGPCATSWLWPDAEEQLKQHTEHLIVTISDEASAIARADLLTQVTAAILATCPDTIGVYWCNAAIVVSPEMFREFAVEVWPPVYIWIDLRVGSNPDGTSSGFTVGLAALDLMEFETQNSSELPGELRERLIGLSGYVIENGPVINDGDTVGEDDHEQIRVLYGDSAFGLPDQVMRLDYGVND